jgi:hypothetical protein
MEAHTLTTDIYSLTWDAVISLLLKDQEHNRLLHTSSEYIIQQRGAVTVAGRWMFGESSATYVCNVNLHQ